MRIESIDKTQLTQRLFLNFEACCLVCGNSRVKIHASIPCSISSGAMKNLRGYRIMRRSALCHQCHSPEALVAFASLLRFSSLSLAREMRGTLGKSTYDYGTSDFFVVSAGERIAAVEELVCRIKRLVERRVGISRDDARSGALKSYFESPYYYC
jgi:hypothetical protein